MGVIIGYSSRDLQLYHSILMYTVEEPKAEKPVNISTVVGYPVGFT
jgi:hypothetical protein